MIPTIPALALVALNPFPGETDSFLMLRDGRIVEGVEMSRTDDSVTLHFANGDVTIPADRVSECIIPGLDEGDTPRDQKEERMLERGFVRFDGDWMSRSRRDRLVESRLEEYRTYVDEAKRVSKWANRYTEETEYFVFESTVPRHVFASYRDAMEAYTEEFLDVWDIKKSRDEPKLIVKFFVDQEAFLQVSGVPRGVGGYFRFFPKPYELVIYYDRLDPEQTERVIYHEAGHYLQKLIDPGFRMPHWPGEAISEYYSGASWDREKEEFVPHLVHEGRLVQIQRDIDQDEWVDLKEMLEGCQDSNFRDYSWGWSFVHFLMDDRRTRSRFTKFISALATGRDIDRKVISLPVGALKTVMGDEMLRAFMKYMRLRDLEDLEEMEQEWYDYIRKDLEISTNRGLKIAGRAAMLDGRKIRAQRLFQEAVDAGTDDPVTFHLYAELLEEEDEHEKAWGMWKRAVELDPLEPTFYIAWGESLVRDPGDEEKKEEGKRMLRLASDIDPENFYLQRNLKRLLAK